MCVFFFKSRVGFREVSESGLRVCGRLGQLEGELMVGFRQVWVVWGAFRATCRFRVPPPHQEKKIDYCICKQHTLVLQGHIEGFASGVLRLAGGFRTGGLGAYGWYRVCLALFLGLGWVLGAVGEKSKAAGGWARGSSPPMMLEKVMI